jgi:hypothetical protein
VATGHHRFWSSLQPLQVFFSGQRIGGGLSGDQAMTIKSLSIVAAAALALSAGAAQAVELTNNGGFETGDFTGWTQFESAPGNQTIVSPGNVGSYAALIDNQMMGTNSIMKQANIGIGTVTPGTLINITFDAKGSFGNGGVAFASFFSELGGGGVSKTEILGGGPLNGGADFDWKTFSFTTTAGPDVTGGVTLELGAATGAVVGSFATMYYDNVSVTAVPEPGTYAMLLAGLGLVGFMIRRRRAD